MGVIPLGGLVDRPVETPRGHGDISTIVWIVVMVVSCVSLLVCALVFS